MGTQKYQTDVNGVIRAIREDGRQLKELIDNRVEGLIRLVEERTARNLQILQTIGYEFKTALEKANTQQKIYQDLQGIKDNTKLLQKLKQIQSQIDVVEERQIPVIQSVKYANKKASSSAIERLLGELTFG